VLAARALQGIQRIRFEDTGEEEHREQPIKKVARRRGNTRRWFFAASATSTPRSDAYWKDRPTDASQCVGKQLRNRCAQTGTGGGRGVWRYMRNGSSGRKGIRVTGSRTASPRECPGPISAPAPLRFLQSEGWKDSSVGRGVSGCSVTLRIWSRHRGDLWCSRHTVGRPPKVAKLQFRQ